MENEIKTETTTGTEIDNTKIKTELELQKQKEEIEKAKIIEQDEPKYLKEAKEAIKNLELQNKRMEENLNKFAKITAENILAGKSFAGQPALTEEEKLRDNARAALAGTGFEHLIN